MIAAILSVVSLKSLQVEKEKQIVDSIQSYLNSYEGGSLNNNLPLIIQKLQQKTALQEILIYDDSCKLLAGSVLTVKNICLNKENFKSLSFDFAQSKIKIFYNYNYSFYDHLRQLAHASIYWLCGIFIITASVLYTFLYFTVLKPLQEIGKSIDESKSTSIPAELSFFQSKIMELKKEILKSEEDRTYFKTSKKVIHDIRNPLLHLRKLIEDGKFSNYELLGKLNDVDFQISSILNKSVSSIYEISLQTFFAKLKEDCLVMFNLELVVSQPNHLSAVIVLDPRHLKNILHNFCRNSFEANASHLFVDWNVSLEGFLHIHFQDDGYGIEENIRDLVMKQQFTTKSNGNGIGLISAKEFLKTVGGDLLLCDSLKGAYFVLKIPLFKAGSEIALIDDDKFFHASWKTRSAEKCLVHTFYSVDEFLQANLPKKISVFVDSDLGEGKPGEIESKKIFTAGYENIYLSTSFCDIQIRDYPWIKSLVPKSGPFTIII
jgi:signal transduction histidine kinase